LLARIGCTSWLKSRCSRDEDEAICLLWHPATAANRATAITTAGAVRKCAGRNANIIGAK
jgi:hypothetical protein